MPKNYQKKKSYGWVWAIVAAPVLLLVFLAGRPGGGTGDVGGEYLTAASSLRDAHGLAVDVADSNKVWIASHTGLYLLQNDQDLYLVGSGRDDYMGFSAHPADPNTFFSSGHPATGGNIGFQKTTDAGRTWQKLSNGARGPVDFHAMAVSQVDPSIIYGWYRSDLQKSTDGGHSWEIVDSSLQANQVISLATDPKEKDTVYAATADAGLLRSQDQGKTWAQPSGALAGDAVTAVALSPDNNQEILVYSQKQGLVKSTDGGQTWTKLDTPFASSMVMYLSFDPNNPTVIYGINRSLGIYKTTDGGGSWKQVR